MVVLNKKTSEIKIEKQGRGWGLQGWGGSVVTTQKLWWGFAAWFSKS